jgi:hypothetical protein
MLRLSLAALMLSLAASAAGAQEVIRNDSARADPPAAAGAGDDQATQTDARANGAWAQAVLDKAAETRAGVKSKAADTSAAGKAAACVRNPDRSPHGEAWVSAGTGGYRDYGAVATQPVGDGGQVTIGFEQGADSGYGRGRRGR